MIIEIWQQLYIFQQVTFQACSISEARYLYDQLATICPIVVSNGHLTDELFLSGKSHYILKK